MGALIACPSCSCHAFARETRCPSCGALLRASDGSIPRTAGAVLLGLSLTVTAAACHRDGGGGGGFGNSGSGIGGAETTGLTGSTAMSSYGCGPSCINSATSSSGGGAGGAGGGDAGSVGGGDAGSD